MFRVEQVVRKGWWNTTLRVAAAESFVHEERRTRYSGLHVARIETWHFKVQKGETFEVKVPSDVPVKPGDLLSFQTLMRDRPLRRNWTLVEVF